MAAPARPFGAFGLFVRLAASALFGILAMESPTLFSSAPARGKPWDEGVWAALFSAIVIFGLSYFVRSVSPDVDKRVNKGLTMLLAIPVIAASPFVLLVLLRLLFLTEP